MRIYVCVKHVPDTAANIKLTDNIGFDDSVCQFTVNPYDEYAIEQAVQLVEKNGGEVVVVSVGKKTAATAIRSAMAMGAHRGILVTANDQFLDSRTTAQALKNAIEQDGKADIVIGGKRAVDSEGHQTLYRLAAAVNVPVVNEISTLEEGDGKVTVGRELGDGIRESLEVTLPCVLGATKGLNEPRYPKFPDIMKAKKKPIKEIALADLSLSLDGAKIELVELEEVPERTGARMMVGDVRQAVETLVKILKEEEKII